MRVIVLVALLGMSRHAVADDADSSREARIDRGLRAAHDAATVWHWSWVGTFSALFAAQGVLVGVAEDDDGRWVQGVGGIAPAVGLGLQLGSPLAALDLDDDLAALEGDPSAAGDPRVRLASKRRLLRRYARSEAEQRNWFAHVGPLVLNLSVAAVSGAVFDDWVSAGVQLGAGVLISEIKVFTSPTAARDADRAIDAEDPALDAPSVTVTPVLGVGYVGFAGHF